MMLALERLTREVKTSEFRVLLLQVVSTVTLKKPPLLTLDSISSIPLFYHFLFSFLSLSLSLSLSLTLFRSLTHSFTPHSLLIRSSFAHSRTHSRTHALTHVLTNSLTHSLTQSLIHSLFYFLWVSLHTMICMFFLLPYHLFHLYSSFFSLSNWCWVWTRSFPLN